MRNDANNRQFDEDSGSAIRRSTQAPALSVGRDPNLRALVRGLSAEPAVGKAALSTGSLKQALAEQTIATEIAA